MDFDRLLLVPIAALALAGCASDDPRRFRLRAPVTRDQDLDDVRVSCRATPTKDDPAHRSCLPGTYESSFAWDAVDHLVFRPVVQALAVDPGGEAVNVNALDEVPDSSWFTNRIGVRPMSPAELAHGYCAAGKELRDDDPAGTWVIDHGKDNGANPGFRVKVDGTKFMLKIDDDQFERATAATSIASRLYFAAGWWAPCDSVVYFKRDTLKLTPGLTVKANVGGAKPFDQAMLERTLAKAARRGEDYRAAASRWLPGEPLGPFTYEGTRRDDPSDVIPHEDRRDLRGARVIAAWLNHFDSREQNSMETWMAADPKDPTSAGHVQRWYIDLGDCFGSEWAIDGFSRRHGQSTMFDLGDIGKDFVTLGIPERPWDRARRTPGAENFGYFRATDFDPDTWVGEYPNPAFGRMTERDAAWAARILARITPAHVEAAVAVGRFSKPEHTRFLTETLLARRMTVLRRYFAKLSPLADARLADGRLCAVDLARQTGTYPEASFGYRASVRRGRDRAGAPAVVTPEADGRVCLPLPSAAPDAGPPDEAIDRYVVVRIENGATPGPLLVHLYDLGPTRGLVLVGLERPTE